MCRGTPAGLQALALTMPPQRRPSPMWDGCLEAGDIATYLAGHRLVVELSNNEPLRDSTIRCCRRTPSTYRSAGP
jgi:hypothetical protein